jgi:DNA anti-recombination protein RmuC
VLGEWWWARGCNDQLPGTPFADRRKFPREQILGLFESNKESELEEARVEFVRVMKAETKRIKAYIQPEHGTTEIALMYLPSETLYMEAIRNRELADWLNLQHVFPVSPNTLLMTLQTIALVHKWYEVAESVREEPPGAGQGTEIVRSFPEPV